MSLIDMSLIDLLSWLFGRRPRPTPDPVPDPNSSPLLLAAHNAARGRHGLPPLQWDSRLAEAARSHAAYMAERGILAHAGIGDLDPWSRIAAAGYRYAACAENVAEGQRDEAEVMADWLADPPHAAAILGAHRDLGAAVAVSPTGVRYWCVDLAAPAVSDPRE